MRKRHIVSLLLILAAGAFVLASDRSHDAIHKEQSAHHDHGDHVHVATTDMLRHAADHLGHEAMHHYSVGSAPEWMAEWELHWLDVEHGDHHARIYHAMHTHHPHLRYVAIVDPEHHHSGAWTRVH